MELYEFINLVDPDCEGRAWLTFKNKAGEMEAKANTCSSFLSPISNREIDFVRASGEDEFEIYLIGDL